MDRDGVWGSHVSKDSCGGLLSQGPAEVLCGEGVQGGAVQQQLEEQRALRLGRGRQLCVGPVASGGRGRSRLQTKAHIQGTSCSSGYWLSRNGGSFLTAKRKGFIEWVECYDLCY